MKESLVAIFDVDKTLLPGYTIIDFAEYLVEYSSFRLINWQNIESCIQKYKQKSINYNQFADQIVSEYALGLSGESRNKISELSNTFWKQRLRNLYPYVKMVFSVLDERSGIKIAISGSTKESLKPLLAHLNFDNAYVTEVNSNNEVYLDSVKVNAASHINKLKMVEQMFKEIPKDAHTIGFGDSIADNAFLERTDYSVVIGIHDRELNAIAKEKRWMIIMDPLTANFGLEDIFANRNIPDKVR